MKWVAGVGVLDWCVSSIAEVGLLCVCACVVGRGGGLYMCGDCHWGVRVSGVVCVDGAVPVGRGLVARAHIL